MRAIPAFVVLASLVGCTSEYTAMPEARGEWVPANPPSLTAAPAPVSPVGFPIRLTQAQRRAAR